jgi:hypothetical protein
MPEKTKTFACPHCSFVTDKPPGWRKHMSGSHKGYSREELQKAGLEENAGDRIRYLSGFKNMAEVGAAAPESEGQTTQPPTTRIGPRTPRLSKEEQEKAAQQAEFERLRPMLVKKWERRLRMLYGTWSRLAGDKKIALEDKEATEGAEQHVELMMAFGWMHAGKIEAIADVCMWHGAAILSRSDLGQQLMNSFNPPVEEPPQERLQ